MIKTFFTNAAAAEHIITGSNIGHGSHIIQAAKGKNSLWLSLETHELIFMNCFYTLAN